MSSLVKSEASPSKAVVSAGNYPRYVDPLQPPSKKKPFSAIMSQDFTHTVEVVLPEELYDVVWKALDAKVNQIQYSQVIVPLSTLLDGDFFNLYIKTGNILMLSEGRPGVDDKYFLKNGQLRLELAKETYERSGLPGKTISDGGRKHTKTRYAVEIDLRKPSMLHGKRGFERIVWAFKNVLNHSVTWLFHDFDLGSSDENQKPVAKHHPITKLVSPQRTTISGAIVPEIDPTQAMGCKEDFEEWALELYEWLGLVGIESPRILANDNIDSFLSRYQLPHCQAESQKPQSLTCVRWSGLLPAEWVRNLLIAVCFEIRKLKRQAFFSLSAHAFPTKSTGQQDSYTVLCLSSLGESKGLAPSSAMDKDERTTEDAGMRYVLWETIS